MTRFHGTWAALLVAATFTFAACGGDDETDTSTTGAGTVETTTGTTGTTESGTTRERTGTNEDRTDRTETRERGDDKGGSTSGGSGGGSGDDNSGSGGGGSGSKSEELTAANTFSTARTVCRNFLPKPLEKDLKDGDKSAAEIAKDYSNGFPSAQRKKAYDGCLAGLKGKD